MVMIPLEEIVTGEVPLSKLVTKNMWGQNYEETVSKQSYLFFYRDNLMVRITKLINMCLKFEF
jgi:hypothetical protein